MVRCLSGLCCLSFWQIDMVGYDAAGLMLRFSLLLMFTKKK